MRTPKSLLTLSRWLHSLLVLVLFSASATAQQTQGKWEVELHGGWAQAFKPSGGTAFLPDPAALFRTFSGEPSRRVSSWYFGDGASLLNDVNAALRISPRIVPLDPALHSPVSRRSDAMFGARISRQITTRLAAEFSFDYNRSQLEISDATMSDIEASRTSFIAAWNGVLASDAGLPGAAGFLFVSPVVTSTSTVEPPEGRQVLAVGALDINLTRPRTVTPFVLIGAGLMSNLGDVPSVTLKGRYRFLFGGVIPVEETDTVQVRYSLPDHVLAGVFGGGFNYSVSPRSGIRVDARAHVSSHATDVFLDATPAVLTTTPGGFATFTTPSVQVASNPPAGNNPSSLSGPAIADFRTFEGSGTQTQVSVAAGWFWRF